MDGSQKVKARHVMLFLPEFSYISTLQFSLHKCNVNLGSFFVFFETIPNSCDFLTFDKIVLGKVNYVNKIFTGVIYSFLLFHFAYLNSRLIPKKM